MRQLRCLLLSRQAQRSLLRPVSPARLPPRRPVPTWQDTHERHHMHRRQLTLAIVTIRPAHVQIAQSVPGCSSRLAWREDEIKRTAQRSELQNALYDEVSTSQTVVSCFLSASAPDSPSSQLRERVEHIEREIVHGRFAHVLGPVLLLPRSSVRSIARVQRLVQNTSSTGLRMRT